MRRRFESAVNAFCINLNCLEAHCPTHGAYILHEIHETTHKIHVTENNLTMGPPANVNLLLEPEDPASPCGTDCYLVNSPDNLDVKVQDAERHCENHVDDKIA